MTASNNRTIKTVFQVKNLVHAYDQNNNYLWGKEGKLIKHSDSFVELQTNQGLIKVDLRGNTQSTDSATA